MGGESGSTPYVVVVGGANMDISGRSAGPLVPHDSNLGTVRISHGGVGRNIAHNLALLGVDVRLVSAFGNDDRARALMAGCLEAGIDVSRSLIVPGGTTSTYLFVMDETGEMQVAINDMAILEQLTQRHLEERLDLMSGAALCFVDTNLSADTVRWMCETVDVPLFCDPISTTKAKRLAGVLGHLHTLKPNRLEAETLSGVRIHNEASLTEAAQRLLDTGLEQVFISLGSQGLYCADHQRAKHLPLAPGSVRNTTGAGDAMAAALAWAHLHGCDLLEAGRAGLAAAAIAVEGDDTINPQLNEQTLCQRMQRTTRREQSL